MHIPRPKSWDEFQDIALTSFKLRWRSPTLQQNGRSGQPQAGVDISGPDDLGRPVGVQCKLTVDELELPEVEAEIAKAEAFQPRLAAFYVATSGERDVKIQTDLRVLSERRLAGGKFPVGIMFWDDLMESLTESPADFKKHYPQIRLESSELARPDLLCVLDAAYYGSNLRHCLDLVFGEFGRMGNENPFKFEARMRGVSACARPLMDEPNHLELT